MAGYAFHCGVLQALERNSGWDPRSAELIIGTSAGAITGALLRGEQSTSTLRRRLIESTNDPDEISQLRLLAGRSAKAVPRFWTGPSSTQLALAELRKGRSLRPVHLATALLPSGRLDLAPITKQISELHEGVWPSKDLWIPATDLETGERVVFGRRGPGPVSAQDSLSVEESVSVEEAVQASSTLPGFFAPTEIGGRRFVDGGVGSAVNASLVGSYFRNAEPSNVDRVIISSPLSIDRLAFNRPVATLARAYPRWQLRRELEEIQDLPVNSVVFEPDRSVVRAMGLNPMNPDRMASIAEAADALACRIVKDSKLLAFSNSKRSTN